MYKNYVDRIRTPPPDKNRHLWKLVLMFNLTHFSIQRCECNSAGACDWSGDRGRCEDDIQLPPALAALAESSAFGGSLLSAAKCKTLPVTEMGFWRCDEVQTCQLV